MSDFTFPRHHPAGWSDDGASLPGAPARQCWSCGSSRYLETLSTESCAACGLRVDYWSDAPVNHVGMAVLEGEHEREIRRENERAWARERRDEEVAEIRQRVAVLEEALDQAA